MKKDDKEFLFLGAGGDVLRDRLGAKIYRLLSRLCKTQKDPKFRPMDVDIEKRPSAIKLRIRAFHWGLFSQSRYVRNTAKYLKENGVNVSDVEVWGCRETQPNLCDEAIITCSGAPPKKESKRKKQGGNQ